MKDNIVITGTGLVSSLGSTAPDTWKALLSGSCGIRLIDVFNPDGFESRHAALAKELSAEELNIHPRDSRIMDKHSYMLMKASRDAFSHAKLDSGNVPAEEIGYFAGMGMIDYNTEDLLPAVLKSLDSNGEIDLDEFFSKAYREIHPLWPLSMLNNISFCQVAIDLGIKGENTVFSPHADSGAHAVIEAYNSIAENKSRVALAGGVSEKVSPLSIARALMSGLLNTGETSCMPFGKNRNGSLLGEGSGIVTTELESSAVKRGLPALAAVTGYGSSFGLNGKSSGAISRSMEDALKHAELRPSDIDLIIAHGDGTKQGDKDETESIHQTFAECVNKTRVYSSKGALGHMLSGAPAADIILGIHIMKNGIIPATCKALQQDESIEFNLISSEPVKADLKRILINSRSTEGQCTSLIIEAME